MKRKLYIDVATIYPGEGGAGGGIWRYTKNLIKGLDQIHDPSEFQIICIVNKEFDLSLNNIEIRRVRLNLRGLLTRIFYVHLFLPFFVFFNKGILHKVYFEVPFFSFTKTMVTIHDLMMDFYKGRYKVEGLAEKLKLRYFTSLNTRAIRRSNLIFTPSRSVAEEIRSAYKIPGKKIVVTPLASEFAQYDKVIQRPAVKTIKIYCIAAFHPHKGHERVFRIVEEMCISHHADIQLYFRGHIHNQEYFDEIKRIISHSSIADRVIFLGYKENFSIQEIYAESDWLILLSEYEGFGLPVIEAQSNGVPVICSDIPVFREVAGDSAFFISTDKDIKAEAQLLHNFIADESNRRRLIDLGYSNSKNYTWDRFANQVLSVYKTMFN